MSSAAAIASQQATTRRRARRDWLRRGHNVLLTGATGVGKTWIACALAQQAARCGFSVLYARCARLLEDLLIDHCDGSFPRRLAQLAEGLRRQLERHVWTWPAPQNLIQAL